LIVDIADLSPFGMVLAWLAAKAFGPIRPDPASDAGNGGRPTPN
jgi:hypothetical protein